MLVKILADKTGALKLGFIVEEPGEYIVRVHTNRHWRRSFAKGMRVTLKVVDNKEFIDGVTAIAVKQNPKIAEQHGFRNFFRNAPTVAFVACPEES